MKLPTGYHRTMLSAAFSLLLDAGYDKGEVGTADIGLVVSDPQPAPEGYVYAGTYPIVDEIGPGVIHSFYSEETYLLRLYLPVIDGRFFTDPA